jgi:hypothetical protein
MTDPAVALEGEALHAHMTTLNDEQLSDLIAAVDAAEIISKARDIDMGASALWYASKLGWPVFPLKPRGKKPITAHGFKDASTDPDRVATWWTAHPDANIGIPTGPASSGGCSFDVLDVDGPAGIRAWGHIKHAACPPDCCAEQFCPATGPFDIVATAFTPGDGVDRKPGRHLYLRATGKGNTTGIAGQALDYRGAGGYVVAPPSVGLHGLRYSWLQRPPLPDAT